MDCFRLQKRSRHCIAPLLSTDEWVTWLRWKSPAIPFVCCCATSCCTCLWVFKLLAVWVKCSVSATTFWDSCCPPESPRTWEHPSYLGHSPILTLPPSPKPFPLPCRVIFLLPWRVPVLRETPLFWKHLSLAFLAKIPVLVWLTPANPYFNSFSLPGIHIRNFTVLGATSLFVRGCSFWIDNNQNLTSLLY